MFSKHTYLFFSTRTVLYEINTVSTLKCIYITGQKSTDNYYARNREPWDNQMFISMGYDAETPSNSHLYVAAKERTKQKKRMALLKPGGNDSSSNEDDEDYVQERGE